MRRHDIDLIMEQLSAVRPEIDVMQLQVCCPGDDDGLWYVGEPGGAHFIQLESSTYDCPFLVEVVDLAERFYVHSVEDAVARILALMDSGNGGV